MVLTRAVHCVIYRGKNGFVESKQGYRIAGVMFSLLAYASHPARLTALRECPAQAVRFVPWLCCHWTAASTFLSFKLLTCKILQTSHRPCLSCKAYVSKDLVKCLARSEESQLGKGWREKNPPRSCHLSNTLVIIYSLKMFPKGLTKVFVCCLCNKQPTLISKYRACFQPAFVPYLELRWSHCR